MEENDLPKTHPLRFVYEFLDYVDTVGIYDYFDEEENCMRTSEDVEELIEMARACAPERISNEEAAEKMRNLTDAERDAFIEADQENVIIDLRSDFSKRIAENGGARGILEQLVAAQERGDTQHATYLYNLAKEFTTK